MSQSSEPSTPVTSNAPLVTSNALPVTSNALPGPSNTLTAQSEVKPSNNGLQAGAVAGIAIGVAVGSSMQISLLVIPLSIIIGWIIHADMTLVFDNFQIAEGKIREVRTTLDHQALMQQLSRQEGS